MAGRIEDKLDRYHDDLLGNIKVMVELLKRSAIEQKELKEELLRLKDLVAGKAGSAEQSSQAPTPGKTPEAPGVAAATATTPAPKPKTLKEYLADGVSLYDVKVLNAFIKAAKGVIKDNCRKEPVFLKPRIEENLLLPCFVVGKMKLSREGGQGAMALAFERGTMEQVARDVLMLPPDAAISESDGKDVTSELCNQVVGRSKMTLRSEGYKFDISVPAVTADANPAKLFKALGGCPKLALTFSYEKLPFYVLFWG